MLPLSSPQLPLLDNFRLQAIGLYHKAPFIPIDKDTTMCILCKVTHLREVTIVGNVRMVLPDDLHLDLKRQALEERTTLTALLIKALQEYLERCKVQEKRKRA